MGQVSFSAIACFADNLHYSFANKNLFQDLLNSLQYTVVYNMTMCNTCLLSVVE